MDNETNKMIKELDDIYKSSRRTVDDGIVLTDGGGCVRYILADTNADGLFVFEIGYSDENLTAHEIKIRSDSADFMTTGKFILKFRNSWKYLSPQELIDLSFNRG